MTAAPMLVATADACRSQGIRHSLYEPGGYAAAKPTPRNVDARVEWIIIWGIPV